MRVHRYRQIADELGAAIGAGDFAPGDLLPSEAELSTRHQVSRVTVRRALEALRADGLVDSRQGFGWFVARRPVRQHLDQLATIEAQLEAAGVASERRVAGFALVDAPERVRGVLGAARVLEVRRVNLADGRPFARVTVWCPARLAGDLSLAEVASSPISALLDVELGGATQVIGAAVASETDAEALEVPVGSAVLVCERVTRSVDGTPVLLSEHVFPAHLTEFTVELDPAEATLGPSGLRLVD